MCPQKSIDLAHKQINDLLRICCDSPKNPQPRRSDGISKKDFDCEIGEFHERGTPCCAGPPRDTGPVCEIGGACVIPSPERTGISVRAFTIDGKIWHVMFGEDRHTLPLSKAHRDLAIDGHRANLPRARLGKTSRSNTTSSRGPGQRGPV